MLINTKDYFAVLEDIKARIKEAQYKAVLGANCEQILLYWDIGKVIFEKSQWGNKFVDHLSRNITSAFPNTKGY